MAFSDATTIIIQKSNKVCILDTIKGDFKGEIEIDGVIASINGKSFINVHNRYYDINKFDLSDTPFNDACIICKYNDINVYHCDWDIYYTLHETTITKSAKYTGKAEVSHLKSLNSSLCQKLQNIDGKIIITPNKLFFYNAYEHIIINPNWKSIHYSENGTIYQHKEDIILYKDESIYILNKEGYWSKSRLSNSEYDFTFYIDYGVILDKNTELYKTPKGHKLGKLISHIPDKEIQCSEATILYGGRILWDKFMRTPNFVSESRTIGINVTKEYVELLTLNNASNKYDSETILIGIYDRNSYRNVLLSIDGSQFMYREDSVTKVLDIDTGKIDIYENLSFIKHINGIRTQFRAGALQPRIIDPISKELIPHDTMSEYQFISPNGELYADTRLKEYIEYYYLESGKAISHEEYEKLRKDFSYPWYENKDSIEYKKVSKRRKDFILSNFDYFQQNYPDLICNDRTGKHWKDCLLDEKDSFGVKRFLMRFIGSKGIAIIRKTADNSEFARIDLGLELEFLNYVSFSYDSEFVSLAGYRGRGLFILYDLKKKETIINENASMAVWNTAFSSKGALSAYTSSPNTLLIPSKSDYYHPINNDVTIVNRSFLTFSPDGRYFALSSQGYRSKYDKYGNVRQGWGHQPSSLVELRSVSSKSNIIVSFNDISDEGIEDCSIKHTVASVSFSEWNRRIMMVGNDGVVIIRNLHLENYASE